VIECRDDVFDEVPTHCPIRYFPLLLTDDSLDESQHVLVDLSPLLYDASPLSTSKSASSSTPPTVTGKMVGID
jgi:hypothetical protein